MPSHDNARLNQALIRLHRSLLEYVGECWPWVGQNESAEQTAVNSMLALRQAEIAKLVDLLAERGWPIDFGTYPTEYTDLHYVALDYLIGQLIADSDSIRAELEHAAAATRDDSAAAVILAQISSTERIVGEKLRELRAAHSAAAAGSTAS